MKTAIRFMAALVVAALCSNSALAQNGQAGIVAVIDVAKVFEAHAGHQAKLKEIQADVTALEEEVKQSRTSLNSQLQALQALVGQPNYKEEEAKLARADAEFTIQANQKRAEIVNREAQLYFQTYTDIVATVARLCQSYNISLVINFDSSEIDPTNRESIIKGVNRNVVFQRELDLTALVIEQVNAPR